jgi:uncharacterized caspase-like protein
VKTLRFVAGIAIGIFLSATSVETALADKRVALVIGNSAYQNVPKLANPVRDAQAVAQMFKDAKFDSVLVALDVDYLEFVRKMREFADAAETADIAVVYYSGHGIEINGTSFMIPTDAKLARARDAMDEAVTLDRVIFAVEPAKRLRLIILDASRDNPFPANRTQGALRQIITGVGSVPPQISIDTLIVYAAKQGQAVEDGTAEHSPFAAALLHNLTEPGLDIRFALGRVRDEVLKATNNRQEIFVSGSIGGSTIALVPAKPAQPFFEPVQSDYELVKKINTKKAWEIFLEQYPSGAFHDLAQAQLDALIAKDQAK